MPDIFIEFLRLNKARCCGMYTVGYPNVCSTTPYNSSSVLITAATSDRSGKNLSGACWRISSFE